MSNYYVHFSAVIHITNIVLFYGIKILNGKRGKMLIYMKIVGQNIAKLLLANDFKPMVKASK